MAFLTTNGVRFATSDEINNRTWIFQSGVVWVFHQTVAPLGWTTVATQNNKALRVVSGTGGGSAGTNSFTSTMSSFNYAGNVGTADATGGHPLGVSQIPAHTHSMTSSNYALSANPAAYNPDGSFNSWTGGDVSRYGSGWTRGYPATGSTGSGDNHSHPIAATAPISVPISLAVQYVDINLCSFSG